MGRPRILFIDAYDSYSNNVVSLLTTLLQVDVDFLHIDSPRLDYKSPSIRDTLKQELQYYDAVVCGPGPGSPTNATDVGLIKHIWELDQDHLVPVLGICLGFQSLAVSCGAQISKIPGGGLHGMVRTIDFLGDDSCCKGNIFAGVAPFKATLYHSLCAHIGQALIPDSDWPASKWKQYPATDIVPIAWVEEIKNGSPERLLMGMKHATKPFWGLQYHPESVCSEESGHRVVRNWFEEARIWNREHGRVVIPRADASAPGAVTKPLLQRSAAIEVVPQTRVQGALDLSNFAVNSEYFCETIPLPSHVEVPDVVEILQSNSKNQIILDSASAHANRIGLDVRGKYSVIALDIEDSLRFEYCVGDSYILARLPPSLADTQHATQKVDLQGGVWQFLAGFMDRRALNQPDVDSPFLGGFMGYITYELGLECINVENTAPRYHHRPDLCFAWVQKSIVIDHLEGTVRLQYLHSSSQGANQWIKSAAAALQTSSFWKDGLGVNDNGLKSNSHPTPPITPLRYPNPPTIVTPVPDEYESKVRVCQDYIASGDSYELCLTSQTSIAQTVTDPAGRDVIPTNSWAPSSATKTPSSWHLYRTLRTRQPAPFGSYIRLGGATLISSSPERFLEYDRNGLCSMRPMKGTVRKSAACATLAEAEKTLHTPKEEAENLMIVDLVRHDLHSVCGPGNVTVPQLLKVHEYANVFSMISVVEGQLPPAARNDDQRGGSLYTGLDVLAASLPPGSMTGAPKKRSCEILQEIESHQERSLYSGVVGYMDVTGKGDWSVTIRSLFRWDDETRRAKDGNEAEIWRIGAGGAVTALSTAEGETEEMFVKLKGPLGVFEERS